MSAHASLDAASQDRKARLAQLKSLKRKQPPSSTDEQSQDIQNGDAADVALAILSGRNYDPQTRGPKLGFEVIPGSNGPTLESQSAALAEATKAEAQKDETEEKPLDLFKLQPKKPNWDLKRDLERKLQILNVRTDNAIAKIVRERIQQAQQEAKAKSATNGGSVDNEDGEAVGMDGSALVEAMHVREREEEEDERRDRADEELS